MIWIVAALTVVGYFVVSLALMARRLMRTAAIVKAAKTQTSGFQPSDPKLPSLKLLLTGDSIPAASGIDSFNESLGGQLVASLSRHYSVTMENHSVVGLKVRGLHDQAFDPTWDLIIILIGANDSLRVTPFSSFESDLNEVLRKCAAVKKVILTGPGEPSTLPVFPFWIRYLLTLRERRLRAIMESVAAKTDNVVYLNPHRALNSVNWQDPRYLSKDRFHPSAAGHRVWYEIIAPQLDLPTRVEPSSTVQPRGH